MKKLLTLLAVLGFGYGNCVAQNTLLTSSNQFFSITNYGPGPATLPSMSGLPLGTWPSGSATGEVGLKVVVVNPVSTGTSGGSTVSLTGTSLSFAASTITTSGSFNAGLRSLDLLVVSGTLTLPTSSGTISLGPNQTYGRSVSPNTFPTISYTISSGGTTQAITTQ